MRKPGPGGFVLAVTLFLILILSLVAFGALSLATLDTRSARQDYAGARALYAARAGVSRAMDELASNYAWSSGSGLLTADADQEAYSVTVVPAPDNASRSEKLWRVTSVGSCEGAQRRVEAILQLESFARFIFFTNREFTTSGTPIYFFTQDRLDGPVHTNGYFSISGHPRFADRMTSANSGDSLFNATDFTYRQEGTQTDPARFYHTHTGYGSDSPVALDSSPRFSFAGGQNAITMPLDTGQIKNMADHAYSGTIEFQFRDNGTVLVRRRTGNSWRNVETIPSDTLPGVTLHVNGELYASGTVKGRVTIGATKTVHLNGDLVYADPSRDVLGLVGQQDILVESSPNQRKDRYVHGVMMALNGSFRVPDYDSGSPRGVLHVFGGIVQSARGAIGTFSGSAVSTGYSKNYIYDEKLPSTPPLNFPTTGNLQIQSLIDRGSLGGS